MTAAVVVSEKVPPKRAGHFCWQLCRFGSCLGNLLTYDRGFTTVRACQDLRARHLRLATFFHPSAASTPTKPWPQLRSQAIVTAGGSTATYRSSLHLTLPIARPRRNHPSGLTEPFQNRTMRESWLIQHLLRNLTIPESLKALAFYWCHVNKSMAAEASYRGVQQ
jgi:hypothetical protein